MPGIKKFSEVHVISGEESSDDNEDPPPRKKLKKGQLRTSAGDSPPLRNKGKKVVPPQAQFRESRQSAIKPIAS